jgi:hypothetical protein
MPTLHAVLDTNIYRQLRPETAQDLKERELSQGVKALIGFGPALELGAHLADETDPDFWLARRAFSAMWHHTWYDDGARLVVPMLHDSDSQLAWGLFRQQLPHRKQEAEVFGWALGALASSGASKVPDELRPAFQAMRDRVAQREAKFGEDMMALVKLLDPEAIGWHPHSLNREARADLLARIKEPWFIRGIASGRVAAAAELCNVSLSESETTTCVQMVLESFPTAMHFFRNLVKGMIESGVNFSLRQHANSAWDMALAFVASPDSSVDGVLRGRRAGLPPLLSVLCAAHRSRASRAWDLLLPSLSGWGRGGERQATRRDPG